VRRLVGSMIVGLALVAMMTGPALAAKPVVTPLELPPQLELPAGSVCPFDVTVDFLANKGKTTTFSDASGNPTRSIGTGTLKIRVTNTTDPARPSTTLNISGPVHTRFHADGSSTQVYGGRSVSLFPPGTFVLTAGRAVVHLDASGNFVSVTNTGFSRNICAAVAA
jgi:hypothetical protein